MALGEVTLEVCKNTDERYKSIRDRHYVENRGTHGQQLHFLVRLDGEIVGIISGASSVYAVRSRDDFFAIPADKERKQKVYLPAIINNVVFRLEHHVPNLATKVLAKWRKVVAQLWEELYGVKVIGFETFVVEEDWRKGSLYLADNWKCVGETAGSTKAHKGLTTASTRVKTSKKLVYCRWIKGKQIVPEVSYVSSWRASTPEEKARAKELTARRKEMLGKLY